MFLTEGPSRGLSKFSGGSRVSEFDDRKLNPKPLLEGQCKHIVHFSCSSHRSAQTGRRFAVLSLRLRLSRFLAALPLAPPTPTSFAATSLEPDPISETSRLPSRMLVAGGGSANPAMLAILGTVMGSEVVGMPDLITGATQGDVGGTTSSALGAAKKARWAWARTQDGTRNISFADYEHEIEATPRAAGTDPSVELMLSDHPAAFQLGKTSVVNGGSVGRARLVPLAKPDWQEFEFYGSMLAEFERLSMGVSKGLI